MMLFKGLTMNSGVLQPNTINKLVAECKSQSRTYHGSTKLAVGTVHHKEAAATCG